jgi:long-subunit fatty acid transport protein
MYKKIFVILLILSQISLLYANTDSIGTTAMDFLKISRSVKAESVGDALTASLESTALNINPASIARISQIEINFFSLNYVEDIKYHNIFMVMPTSLGNLGMEAGYIDLGGQTRTTFTNKTGSNADMFGNNGYQVMGVYANSVADFNFGFGLKYVAQTLDTVKTNAFSLDLGLNYQLFSNLTLGTAINNITLKKAATGSEEAELTKTLRFGLGYDTQLWENMLNITCDIVVPNDDEMYIGVGGEYAINNYLKLRLGYLSYAKLAHFSGGLGLNLDNISIDFSYKPYKDFGASYRIGFGLKL